MPWTVPGLYALGAIASGILLPRLEAYLWPHASSGISVASATTIYSTIAAGTMTLSAIVFSLTFVMVQFSATAYSPRLVLWLAEDPMIAHAFGVFTATFLYAIAAIAWVDRDGGRTVPVVSAAVVIVWLVASIAMFIGLIQRVAMLQVNRMLSFAGDQGRRVIAALYSPAPAVIPDEGLDDIITGQPAQVLTHRGRPRAVRAIDVPALVKLACGAGAAIEVVVAVGDTVMESTPLLRVYGGVGPIDERPMRAAISVGEGRTFEQDPQFAIRMLVDIAIRALSPAVNDPTTAVQALDEIGDLLLRLGRCALTTAAVRDDTGVARVVVPLPTWDDFLRLAFDEICSYGATSLQVMRRMNALVSQLTASVPPYRRPALVRWRQRLHSSIGRHFVDLEERHDASVEDRQGFGVSRRTVA
jgi:uncharacterized membrane protein